MKKLILLVIGSSLLFGCALFSDDKTATNSNPVLSETGNVNLDDQSLTNILVAEINHKYPDDNVQVAVYNKEVLLTGQVGRLEDRYGAEELVRSYSEVKQVFNYLQVATLESRADLNQDSLITRNVKAKLLTVNDAVPSSLKVITTNNVVYIFGVITDKQQRAVIENTQAINGVKNVIILNYKENH